MNYEQTLDLVIEKALKAGATQADAAIDSSNGVDVSVRNGQLETVEREIAWHVAALFCWPETGACFRL